MQLLSKETSHLDEGTKSLICSHSFKFSKKRAPNMLARQSQATIPPKCKQFKYKHDQSKRFQVVHKKSYQVSAKECRTHHNPAADISTSPPSERCKNLNSSMKSGVLLLLLLVLAISCHLVAPVNADGRSPRSAYSSDDTTAVTSKARMPYFAEVSEESKRHRAIVGRPARFECVVMDLGHRSVAWFHKSRTHALMAIGNKTILFKDRIKASIQGNSIFSLEFKKVQLQDEGEYSCQITNLPPDSTQNQYHFLEVLQSPQINESESTIKINPVDEGKTVEMRCVAYGVPKPAIKWRRKSRLIELPATPDASEVGDNELPVEPSSPAGPTNDELASRSASGEQPQVASQSRAKRSSQDSRAEPLVSTGASRHRRAPNVAPIFTYHGSRTRRATTPPATQTSQTQPFSSTPTAATLSTGSTTSLNPRISGAANKPIRAEGESFRIESVSRYDMGYYECIAANGVQPAVSQLIFLPVNWQNKGAGIYARNNSSSSDSNGNNFITSSTASTSSTSTAFKTGGGPRTQTTLEDSNNRPPPASVSVGSGRNVARARYRHYKAARSSASTGSSAPPKLLSGCSSSSVDMSLLTGLALFWCAWLAAAATTDTTQLVTG